MNTRDGEASQGKAQALWQVEHDFDQAVARLCRQGTLAFWVWMACIALASVAWWLTPAGGWRLAALALSVAAGVCGGWASLNRARGHYHDVDGGRVDPTRLEETMLRFPCATRGVPAPEVADAHVVVVVVLRGLGRGRQRRHGETIHRHPVGAPHSEDPEGGGQRCVGRISSCCAQPRASVRR